MALGEREVGPLPMEEPEGGWVAVGAGAMAHGLGEVGDGEGLGEQSAFIPQNRHQIPLGPRRRHRRRDPTQGRQPVRKMDPRPIYFWILVFDDQHNQIGLMNLQVIVL